MAVDYAKEIGFKGQFLIEPKPKEPTKHQYDFDVASGIAFLRTYGLDKYFKFNIETNHATLAGHTFNHEIEVAAAVGMLGSIDANAGDMLLGWDTDQFNTDVKELTLAMFSILRAGGLGSGGFNFDAKLRRPSIDLEDLFYAHIGGMDAYALAYKLALKIRAEGKLEGFRGGPVCELRQRLRQGDREGEDRFQGTGETGADEARRAEAEERTPGVSGESAEYLSALKAGFARRAVKRAERRLRRVRRPAATAIASLRRWGETR